MSEHSFSPRGRRTPWRVLLPLAALLAALGGGLAWWNGQNGETPAAGGNAAPAGRGGPAGGQRPVPVIAEAARQENFPQRLTAIGTVVPRTVVTVRSRVDGTLVRVHFREGDTVRAGELLAEIDPRAFEVALAQAQGQLARDQALLLNARADLERYEALARLDAIATQQLDTQRALVRQYEAAVKVDQGQVDNARLQLSYTRITAPAGGRVGLRQVDPGNLVRSSDSNGLVVITEVQPVTVIFPVTEADLPALLIQLSRAGGRRAEPVAVEAWDREGRQQLASGELLTVDNQIDVSTGTVKAKALFANRDGQLFPNQFVNARLVLRTLEGATVIPLAAVQRGQRGAFVWVVGSGAGAGQGEAANEPTVSQRPVTVGTPDGDRVPVLDGLKPDEMVAVDGFDRLREGARIELVSREARAVKGGGARGGRKGGEGAAGRPAP